MFVGYYDISQAEITVIKNLMTPADGKWRTVQLGRAGVVNAMQENEVKLERMNVAPSTYGLEILCV